MGEEVDHHHHHEAPLLPIIEFPNKFFVQNQEKSEEWRATSNKVRKACEDYGCFVLVMQEETMPTRLREEMVKVMTALFDLPEETKQKHTSPTPCQSYRGKCDVTPLYESFGVDNACRPEVVEAFTNLMWPQGNSSFCTVISMMKQLEELKEMINLMIVDSYNLGENSALSLQSQTLLRMMKYGTPPSKEYTNALPAHTDKGFGTILCDDQVSGLEVETKDGEWIKLNLSPRSLVFMVSDALMAWSNGRMHAVKHRVMMRGEKERYSLGIFAVPLEGSIIKTQKELVDEEHPQILKDFDYAEFVEFFLSEKGRAVAPEKQVFTFAGINT